MIFNTYWFVVFALLFFPVYWLLSKPNLRFAWLLGSCFVFHARFAGPAGVLPIVVLGAVAYFCGLSRKRSLVVAAIVLCVAALVFYKYTYFFSTSVLGYFNPEWGKQTAAAASKLMPALPPLAISFFAFEFVHYLIEVYRGKESIRKPWDFALFAVFFPSLVAGPIKRYRDFLPDMRKGIADVNPDDVAAGAKRVAIGLVKKIIIADNLTLGINFYQDNLASLSVWQTWLFLAAISLRILFDFSGYSDMAIGLSRMMGIRLLENFNYPYIATSIQNFWQRWHISLSTWIRDYVYIPLGGNRLGPVRRITNGLIAFALCGFWHGPSWNFILWGLWHGVGLAVNASYPVVLGAFGRAVEAFFRRFPWIGTPITLVYVCLGWLLFFYEPTRAWQIAVKLFGGAS